MKELLHFFITFSYNFYISSKSVEKLITPQLQDPMYPSILQTLTTFNLYSSRPGMGLSVNIKQKVRQAMVKISTLARYVCTFQILRVSGSADRGRSDNSIQFNNIGGGGGGGQKFQRIATKNRGAEGWVTTIF